MNRDWLWLSIFICHCYVLIFYRIIYLPPVLLRIDLNYSMANNNLCQCGNCYTLIFYLIIYIDTCRYPESGVPLTTV
jgi:hypothetical protein